MNEESPVFAIMASFWSHMNGAVIQYEEKYALRSKGSDLGEK